MISSTVIRLGICFMIKSASTSGFISKSSLEDAITLMDDIPVLHIFAISALTASLVLFLVFSYPMRWTIVLSPLFLFLSTVRPFSKRIETDISFSPCMISPSSQPSPQSAKFSAFKNADLPAPFSRRMTITSFIWNSSFL